MSFAWQKSLPEQFLQILDIIFTGAGEEVFTLNFSINLAALVAENANSCNISIFCQR